MHKFLHLADVHLDSGILCRSEALRTKLNLELQAGFKKSIDFAIKEKVVAVFIAGDLFDADNLSIGTELFIHEQFERLNEAHIPVIYTAGHSDPADEVDSLSERPWPKNVIFIHDASPKVIELQDVDGKPIARVVGAGYTTGKVEENVALRFPQAKEQIPYIGLLHTRVHSAFGVIEEESSISTCEVKHLKAPGYIYWALGGVHQHQRLAGIPNAWYPGNFSGRSADEAGFKGALLVSLRENEEVSVEFKPFSSVQWFDLSLTNLEDIHNVESLFRSAEHAFEDQRGEDEDINVQLIRLTLAGMCPIVDELKSETRRAALEEKLAYHLNVDDVEIRIDHLTAVVDVNAYRNEPHLLSEVLKVIDDVSENSSLLDELTPQVLVRKVSDDQKTEYLKSLAAGFDREAIVRLTREDSHAH